MSLNFSRPAVLIASVAVVATLAGCATNPYHDYYKAEKIPEYEKRYLHYLPEDGTPKLTVSTGDTNEELDEAISHGYVVIGVSKFNAPLVGQEQLAEQAKDVHATHVLYSAKQAGKVLGFAPQAMTAEQAKAMSEQTTHGHDVPIEEEQPADQQDGKDGTDGKDAKAAQKNELFWGMSYLPVSYNKQRFDQTATFLVRSSKKPALGLDTQSLTANQKARLGYNRGVAVKRVYYNSAAFDANLKKGDILYSVNGIVIQDERHFRTIAASYSNAGKVMQFEILRGDEPMSITLDPKVSGHHKAPILIEQPAPSEKVAEPVAEEKKDEQTAEGEKPKDDALKTPEEKQKEAAERWAKRKKAYDAHIKKKEARAKDGFFMGMYHSVTDWFDSDD